MVRRPSGLVQRARFGDPALRRAIMPPQGESDLRRDRSQGELALLYHSRAVFAAAHRDRVSTRELPEPLRLERGHRRLHALQ